MVQVVGLVGGGELWIEVVGGEGLWEFGVVGGVVGGFWDVLSLEEILWLYNQFINEEQVWVVCYQCCGFLCVVVCCCQFCYCVCLVVQICVWRDGVVILVFVVDDVGELFLVVGKLGYL